MLAGSRQRNPDADPGAPIGGAVDVAAAVEHLDALAHAHQPEATLRSADVEPPAVIRHRHPQRRARRRRAQAHLDIDPARLCMARDIGQAFLNHAVRGGAYLGLQADQCLRQLQRSDHLRIALLKGRDQFLQRCRQTQPFELRRAQTLQHAAHHVLDLGGHGHDGLGALAHRGAAAIADRRGIGVNRAQALADLIVQLARQAAALVFLHLQQAPGEPLIFRDALLQRFRHVVEPHADARHFRQTEARQACAEVTVLHLAQRRQDVLNPIADAHYAMGFAFLYELTSLRAVGSTKPEVDLSPSRRLYEAGGRHLQRATHFLDELVASRCSDFEEYCWGYPFNWVWRGGVIKEQTPLITTTPYCYEAFLQVAELLESEVRDQKSEVSGSQGANFTAGGREDFLNRPKEAGDSVLVKTEQSSIISHPDLLEQYQQILESIARHAANDIKDFPTSATASSCSYTPFDSEGVINAAAYRAFLLTSASQEFANDSYWKIAERNLNFVLENQNADGSWYYAVDGVRDFVDHYHTCFVMKALAKIHFLVGHQGCLDALKKGMDYYLKNLFAEDGLPKPFAKAPRLTVYKRELYDCAECINLCLLLRERFPQLQKTLEIVIAGVMEDWIRPDGSFRSRKLHFGWDNVPMHRWGQAQMFRALALYLRETSRSEDRGRKTDDGRRQTGDRRQRADSRPLKIVEGAR